MSFRELKTEWGQLMRLFPDFFCQQKNSNELNEGKFFLAIA